MSLHLNTLVPVMSGSWPVPEMPSRHLSYHHQCKVLGFFLMVLISSSAIYIPIPSFSYATFLAKLQVFQILLVCFLLQFLIIRPAQSSQQFLFHYLNVVLP
jgi:hypothetical protein